MTDASDADLIAAVAAGRQEALMALYDRHGGMAYGLAYRVLGDAGTAEEAVQDAFLQVWRRAGSFDLARGSAVRSWLLTIVHHRAIDLLRKRSARSAPTPIEEMAERLSVPSAWPEVEATLLRERVRAAIGALPAEQRQAIELAYFDGLSHREIAERTGDPIGTVKGRLRLGLRKLSTMLAEPGGA